MLIPYLVITTTAFVILPRRALAAGANLFFFVVGFGPGQFVVQRFVQGSQVSSLSNVRPEDYPTVEGELGRVLDILIATPEALLLPLYVAFPLVLYLSGRYLARNFASEGDLLQRAAMPLTLMGGTLPFAVIVAAAFPVAMPGGRIVMAGIAGPMLFGSAGALTVVVYGRYNWFPSKTYGWAAALVGLVFAAALLPLPPIPPEADLQFQIDLARRFVTTP
jgi:hypothetical protein